MSANVPVSSVSAPPEKPDWVEMSEGIFNLDDVVTEDGKPLENIFVERQQRLLVDPLEVSWEVPALPPGNATGGEAPGTSLVLANVGVFFQAGESPLVPDVMVSLGVRAGEDLTRKENRSYFIWVMGKPPDLALEIVSDHRGDELSYKKNQYARIRVLYYVVFDPQEWLEFGVLKSFKLVDGVYQEQEKHWFPTLNLGLTHWEGTYQNVTARYLRWCNEKGVVLPTGQEVAALVGKQLEQTAQQLDLERQRRERLEQRLRELGVEP